MQEHDWSHLILQYSHTLCRVHGSRMGGGRYGRPGVIFSRKFLSGYRNVIELICYYSHTWCIWSTWFKYGGGRYADRVWFLAGNSCPDTGTWLSTFATINGNGIFIDLFTLKKLHYSRVSSPSTARITHFDSVHTIFSWWTANTSQMAPKYHDIH